MVQVDFPFSVNIFSVKSQLLQSQNRSTESLWKKPDEEVIAPRTGSLDYVQEWYPFVSDITFPTSFIPFSRAEGELLLAISSLIAGGDPITDV
jgi:hypothetical protein